MGRITKGRIIVSSEKLHYILLRLAHQLIESHGNFENSILIGVQPRGVALCQKIHEILEDKLSKKVAKGYLDISLHRDDVRLQEKPIRMNRTEIPYSLDEKNIILVDDVLYSGRTIRAALDTLMDFGRPNDIELLVLIDRRLHRHVPIQAKYIGQSIDSIEKEKVLVYLNNGTEADRVEIFTQE